MQTTEWLGFPLCRVQTFRNRMYFQLQMALRCNYVGCVGKTVVRWNVKEKTLVKKSGGLKQEAHTGDSYLYIICLITYQHSLFCHFQPSFGPVLGYRQKSCVQKTPRRVSKTSRIQTTSPRCCRSNRALPRTIRKPVIPCRTADTFKSSKLF